VEDVLCASNGRTLSTLPAGARVGTCSARRTAQIRALRPDLELLPLRGNVPTRLQRIASGDLDAIVLARAGLVRLGLDRHITDVFPLDRVLPAPAQGALAIQCRADDAWVRDLLAPLDDRAGADDSERGDADEEAEPHEALDQPVERQAGGNCVVDDLLDRLRVEPVPEERGLELRRRLVRIHARRDCEVVDGRPSSAGEGSRRQ